MELPLNQIMAGDCREVLRQWPDECVDMVMFSPPYYGLRNYGDKAGTVWGGDPSCQHEWIVERTPRPNQAGGTSEKRAIKGKTNYSEVVNYYDRAVYSEFCAKCRAWRGQLGLEPKWKLYISNLTEVCSQLKRILKNTGSMYIVLGDTYAGSHCGKGDKQNYRRMKVAGNLYEKPSPQAKAIDYKPKCLIGIPWHLTFALIDDGWILRNEIIWKKPNAMPSSVKDRLTVTHEKVFHFVKSRKYYYNLDAIREPHKISTIKRVTQPTVFTQKGGAKQDTLRGIPQTGNASRHNLMVQSLAKQYRRYLPHEPRHFQLLEMGIPHGGHTGKTVRHDHPLGKNPGDVVLTKHNLAVNRGKGGTSAFGKLKASQKEIKRYVYPERKKYRIGDGYRQGMNRDENELVEKRPLLPKLEELVAYLKKWKGSWSYKQIDRALRKEGDTASHWFTEPDSLHGFSYPSSEDWWKLKELLGFDDIYDKQMTETIYETAAIMPQDRIRLTKHDLAVNRFGNFSYTDPLHVKAYNSRGKNPGDIFQARKEPYIGNNPHRMRLKKDEYTALNPTKPLDLSHPLGKNPGDFWSINTKPFKGAHFAVYPILLCVRPILSSCSPDGVLLDPMCGSGSTMLAAELINRGDWRSLGYTPNDTAKGIKWNIKWIGIELVEDYVAITEQRLKP